MTEGQARLMNFLLAIILLVLLANLFVNLIPYIITGHFLRSIKFGADSSPSPWGVTTGPAEPGVGNFLIVPKESP